MSVFELDKNYQNKIPAYIKDFVIERIKMGEAPSKIVKNIQKVFNKKVSLMFIVRTREKYTELTGEHLETYKEFHNYYLAKKKK